MVADLRLLHPQATQLRQGDILALKADGAHTADTAAQEGHLVAQLGLVELKAGRNVLYGKLLSLNFLFEVLNRYLERCQKSGVRAVGVCFCCFLFACSTLVALLSLQL